MQTITGKPATQFGETASNLFHAAVAAMFGLVTLAAALHVALSLA